MKLNRLRNWALGLIFLAFIVMYIGVFVPVLMPYLLIIGIIMILISVFIYFRVGAMSMQIPTLECPHCHKKTKVLGVEDGCMYCQGLIQVEMAEDGGLYLVPRSKTT
ncbi:zinc ribbon protein [Tumebacillus sp. BK434]|uniref:DUF2614 family zinc ribbon-containing protein n=1 Tax=Tumebacillus sp. BK434 TaxID=2512169 RepID=UPI001046A6E2|nr:DUF2614 family zinc ribbon-containing protein [Tumebacillus sp. BK434]TCP53810.1 zinc ribbon protein [Tumebacillus sp. BK434]